MRYTPSPDDHRSPFANAAILHCAVAPARLRLQRRHPFGDPSVRRSGVGADGDMSVLTTIIGLTDEPDSALGVDDGDRVMWTRQFSASVTDADCAIAARYRSTARDAATSSSRC